MENPATWTKATHVIQAALDEASRQQAEGVIGHSTARIIHDALEREHLLAEGDGWIALTLSVERAMEWIEANHPMLPYTTRKVAELLHDYSLTLLPTPPSVQEEKSQ